MPSWRTLPNDQLAAVMTYVRGSWTNNAPAVASETVRAVRAHLSDAPAHWTPDELRQFREGVLDGTILADPSDSDAPSEGDEANE
jgi:hypothetical protein